MSEPHCKPGIAIFFGADNEPPALVIDGVRFVGAESEVAAAYETLNRLRDERNRLAKVVRSAGRLTETAVGLLANVESEFLAAQERDDE